MAQFDVHRNEAESRDLYPYFIEIQHDLLEHLDTRVVIPLCRDTMPMKSLTPSFEIEGTRVSLATMEMTSVPRSICVRPVANLSDHRSEIIDAIDFLIQGF